MASKEGGGTMHAQPSVGGLTPRVRSVGQEAPCGKQGTGPGNHQMAARTMQGDPRALIHRRALTASGTLPTQVLGDKLPVHQIPPRRDILWPGIAVVYVVRMLPHIAG